MTSPYISDLIKQLSKKNAYSSVQSSYRFESTLSDMIGTRDMHQRGHGWVSQNNTHFLHRI